MPLSLAIESGVLCHVFGLYRPNIKHHSKHVYFKESISRRTFRIFLILFRSGEGKGESEAPGRGGNDFFFENPWRGGVSPGRGARGRSSMRCVSPNIF